MTGITLEVAKRQLENWLEASAAVAQSQEYQIGMRKLRRADAAAIQKQIEYWNRVVTNLEASANGGRGLRISYGTPSR